MTVGAETGQRVPRAQFFVSLDDGRSWNLGTVSAAGGGTPPPGHAARFIAGGPGAWAAVGPDSVWTSADGRAWTLASATGLPQVPGDQVTVLKRTGSGFIAAGVNTPDGDQARATPVIFLSSGGTSWSRLGADRLRLAAGSGRALDIRLAAATGHLILIAGDVATPTTVTSGGSRHEVTVRTGGAWLSDDGGLSWTPVTVPTGDGRAGPVLRRGCHRRRILAGQARDGGRRPGRRRLPFQQRHGLDVRRDPDHARWLHSRPDERQLRRCRAGWPVRPYADRLHVPGRRPLAPGSGVRQRGRRNHLRSGRDQGRRRGRGWDEHHVRR